MTDFQIALVLSHLPGGQVPSLTPSPSPLTPMLKIDQDSRRFKQIVRGKVRENLRKYITHGEMIGRKGRDLISIPMPQLDVPHFRYGQNGSGGVGQGDGEEGTPIAGGDGQQQGEGQAGSDARRAYPRSRCVARRVGRHPRR